MNLKHLRNASATIAILGLSLLSVTPAKAFGEIESSSKEKPLSLSKWCEQRDLLPPTTAQIMYVLMNKAKAKDCKSFERKLQGLEQLDLSYESISDISPLATLTSLKVLDLSNNEINDLEPLSGLNKLRNVDVSNNDISDLNPILSAAQYDAINFSGNPRLQQVLERDYQYVETAPSPKFADWCLLFLVTGTVYAVLVSAFLVVIPKWKSRQRANIKTLDNLADTPYIDAIDSLTFGIESGDNYETWLKLGDTFAAQGQHEKAIEYYDRAIKHEPFAADAWNGIAECLCILKRFQEAGDCYRGVARAIAYGTTFDSSRANDRTSFHDEPLKINEETILISPR
jgi:tetratricopeptide (TPR) repeat protein